MRNVRSIKESFTAENGVVAKYFVEHADYKISELKQGDVLNFPEGKDKYFTDTMVEFVDSFYVDSVEWETYECIKVTLIDGEGDHYQVGFPPDHTVEGCLRDGNFEDCEHSDSEDHLFCVDCGQCREDLDSEDRCIPCGGTDENEVEA